MCVFVLYVVVGTLGYGKCVNNYVKNYARTLLTQNESQCNETKELIEKLNSVLQSKKLKVKN